MATGICAQCGGAVRPGVSMHRACRLAAAKAGLPVSATPKRQRQSKVKGYVAPTAPGTINTAAGRQATVREIHSDAHAWSVASPDGNTTWYNSREEAARVAAIAGDDSYLRPQAAPAYTRYRYGKERTADARSHELAAGLKRSLEGMEPGAAIDAGWLLEMIADGVGQCGFAGPVTVTFSRALFENTYEELGGASYFDGAIPNPTSLPDKITEFGQAFGMTLSVAALAPSSQVSCIDPASGELFVTVLPAIAGLR
jgi:hypothetical protein